MATVRGEVAFRQLLVLHGVLMAVTFVLNLSP